MLYEVITCNTYLGEHSVTKAEGNFGEKAHVEAVSERLTNIFDSSQTDIFSEGITRNNFV